MSDILYDSGVLSDVDIREFWGKGIEIDTYQKGDWAFDLDKQLQLGSIDLRFRPDYKKFNLNEKDTIKYDSILQKRYTTPYDLDVDENLVLNPGDVVLTTTLETVRLSEEFAGILTGRSSIARLGIMVHCCQEFINPGHGQPIPLQLINLSPRTVELVVEFLFVNWSSSSSEHHHPVDTKKVSVRNTQKKPTLKNPKYMKIFPVQYITKMGL